MPALAEAIDALIEANAALRKRRSLAKPERDLAAAMRRAFRAEERAFLSRLALLKPYFPPAVREAAEPIPWEIAFDEAALATLQAFAEPIDAAAAQALASGAISAMADLAIETSFTLDHPAAVDYLRRRGAARVTQIGETTRARLRVLLTQAAEDGLSYDRTAREIRKLYADFSVKRARNIAVFELGDAYEHGTMLVAADLQAAGLSMQKQWGDSNDAKVRPEHRANGAQGWIDLEALFQSGHDRPPTDSGCRCFLTTRRTPTG